MTLTNTSMDRSFMEQAYQLAATSLCHKRQFGAVLIDLPGRVLGAGINSPAHRDLARYCEPCIREGIASGLQAERCVALHAEQAAIILAYQGGYADLSQTVLYVAGLLPGGKKWVLPGPQFYCTICARLILAVGIPDIRLETQASLVSLSPEEIVQQAYDQVLGEAAHAPTTWSQ